jgi:hypothetical protein
MNCDAVLHLLDEVPLALWTREQRADTQAHCISCTCCAIEVQQQQQLFAAFERMPEPQPAAVLQWQPERQDQQASTWSAAPSQRLSYAIGLFLCIGSAVQLFRESGFSWYWLADSTRLESISMLLFQTPALSVALIVLGLVYCLAWTPQNTTGSPT